MGHRIRQAPWILLCLWLIVHGLSGSAGAQERPEALIDMVIVLDRSGSMIDTDPRGLSIPAAGFVLEQLSMANDKNRGAVIVFNNQARVLGQREPAPKAALNTNIPGLIEMLRASIMGAPYQFREILPESPKAFQDLLRQQMRETGDTELGLALSLALDILGADEPGRRKLVVLISDGNPEPHIKDGNRLKALAPLVGKDVIRRVQEGRADAVQRLNQLVGDQILKDVVKPLGERGVHVFPVAFVKQGTGRYEVLTAYLERIKEITTGEKEVVVATPLDLIERLTGAVPLPSSHLQLYTFAGSQRFVPERSGLRTKEGEVVVPDIAGRVRFFFSYPSASKGQRVQMELFRDNVQVLDSENQQPGEVVFDTLLRRDGALAYQSCKVLDRAKVPGKWRVRLTAQGHGAETLPAADLLVDIRSEAELVLETEGRDAEGNLRATHPVSFRFKILGRRGGNEYSLPVNRADAFLVGRSPDDLIGFSERLRSYSKEEHTLLASLEGGFPKPGTYRLTGSAFFSTVPETRELAAKFDLNLVVKSATPIDAWFGPKGRATSLWERNPELRVDLPPLGEQLRVEYKGLQVETKDQRRIDSLGLTVDRFLEQKTGGTLEGDWVKIQPKQITGLSAGRAAPLTLAVELPAALPSRISDGIYSSSLHLRDGSSDLHVVPLALTLIIPRFIASQAEANSPFQGEESDPPLLVQKVIRYPGESPHTIRFPLWSSSVPGVKAGTKFDAPDALEFKEGDSPYEGQARFSQILFESDPAGFPIPGKNEGSPGWVSAHVILKDPSLNGRSFENTLLIEGDRHRLKKARLLVHVRFIPRWVLLVLGTLLLASAGFLLYFFRRHYWLNKPLFCGATCEDFVDGQTGGTRERTLAFWMTFRRKMLGTLRYTPGAGGKLVWIDPSSGKPIVLRPGGKVGPGYRKHRWEINVHDVDEYGYSCEVVSSTLWPWLRLLFGVFALVVGLGSILVFFTPYFLMRALGL